jgi:hypothetical protein
MDTMYYHFIETSLILTIASLSVVYLFGRWFPVQKKLVIERFISRFPRMSRLFRFEGGSQTSLDTEGARGCFSCAPTGACGDCPTNRS